MMKLRMMKLRKNRQQGFTIVELMIATAVLSTILVTVTIIMISIGSLYYKGVNQARVQDGTRSVVDEIAQALELSSQSPVQAAPAVNGTQAYCIGTTRYTYMVGVQIGQPPAGGGPVFQHILWRDTIHSAGTCLTANLTNTDPSLGSDGGGANASDGTELMVPDSRLINFSINPLSSPYTMKVGIAYGDDDLLCSPSVSIGGQSSCATSAPAMNTLGNFLHGDLHCKGDRGQQFCSTSDINTTVVQRLTAN